MNPSAAIKGNMPVHHDSAEIFALSAKEMDPFRNACDQSNIGCNASPFLKNVFNGAVRHRATLWQLAQKLSAPPMPMAKANVALDISRASVRPVSKKWPLPTYNSLLNEMPKSTAHFHLPRPLAQKTARLHNNCMRPTLIQEKFSLDLSTTKKLPEPIPDYSSSIPKLNWHPISLPAPIWQPYCPVNTVSIWYMSRTTLTAISRAENAEMPITEQSSPQRGNASSETLQVSDVDSEAETDLDTESEIDEGFSNDGNEQPDKASKLEEDDGYVSEGDSEDYSTSETSTDLDYLIELMSTYSEQLEGGKYTPALERSASCPSINLSSVNSFLRLRRAIN